MAVQTAVLTSRTKTHTISLVSTAGGDSYVVGLTSTLISTQTSSSSVSLAVNIAAWYVNAGTGVVTITRGTSTVVVATGSTIYPGAGEKLAALSQNNRNDITVNFTTPGQVILELHKVAGVVDPNYNVGDYK